MDAANEMHNEKNVIVDAQGSIVDAEGFMQDAKDPGVDAKEFSVDEKFLGDHEKSPGVDEKNLVQDAGISMQDDSATPALRETPFVHAFFFGVMHEEKSEDAFSCRVLDEETSKDAFPVGIVHPATILCMCCPFVRKRRTDVRSPTRAVDNNGTTQRSTAAGREDMAHSVMDLRCIHVTSRSSHDVRRSGKLFWLPDVSSPAGRGRAEFLGHGPDE